MAATKTAGGFTTPRFGNPPFNGDGAFEASLAGLEADVAYLASMVQELEEPAGSEPPWQPRRWPEL